MAYDPKNLKLMSVGGASPLENFPDLVHGLGVITARWATFDHTLLLLLYDAIGDYAVAEAILYMRNAQSDRLRLIKDLVAVASWDQGKKTAVVAILDELEKLYAERNDLMHSKALASSAHADATFTADVLKKPDKGTTKGIVDATAVLSGNPAIGAVLKKHNIGQLAIKRNLEITLTVELLQTHAERVRQLGQALGALSWWPQPAS